MVKKVLVSSLIASMFLSSISFVNAWYEEIDCSTDPVFSEYSCNQCFDWWEKWQNSYIWNLDDVWKNFSTVDQVMYKELQSFPEMMNLNTSKVSWEQTPSSEWFWSYTEEFNALYDEDKAWYVLKAGNEVTWLKSKLGSAYHLARNEASKSSNIGLLVFSITSNNILEDGEISVDDWVHKECVLYKSGDEKVVKKEKPKELPKTWPEQFFLLLILAMILAFAVLRFRKTES